MATADFVLAARQVKVKQSFRGSGLRFNPNRYRLKSQISYPAPVGKASVSSTDLTLVGAA